MCICRGNDMLDRTMEKKIEKFFQNRAEVSTYDYGCQTGWKDLLYSSVCKKAFLNL